MMAGVTQPRGARDHAQGLPGSRRCRDIGSLLAAGIECIAPPGPIGDARSGHLLEDIANSSSGTADIINVQSPSSVPPPRAGRAVHAVAAIATWVTPDRDHEGMSAAVRRAARPAEASPLAEPPRGLPTAPPMGSSTLRRPLLPRSSGPVDRLHELRRNRLRVGDVLLPLRTTDRRHRTRRLADVPTRSPASAHGAHRSTVPGILLVTAPPRTCRLGRRTGWRAARTDAPDGGPVADRRRADGGAAVRHATLGQGGRVRPVL